MSALSPPSILSLYGDCVASLRASVGFLASAVDNLAGPGSTVADLPRLASAVAAVRHYELLPQPTLAAAEASLQSEIGPAVAELLDCAAHQLARQARRIDTLQARAALQAGRLEGADGAKLASHNTVLTKATAKVLADPLRARMVRQRREQLKYSIERLERELAQKERELRQRQRQSTAGV